MANRTQNVGYIRVSTVEQNTDRQLAGVQLDKVFEEKASAKTINRPEMEACLAYVREGDVLHIHSLDRVCRSGAGDAVKLVEELTGKGVGIRFHKEGMEFYGEMTAAQRAILSILSAVAQMERDLIRERQQEGIAAAKGKGKHLGRAPTEASKADVMELKDKGIPVTQIAKQLGVGRTTVYKLLKSS